MEETGLPIEPMLARELFDILVIENVTWWKTTLKTITKKNYTPTPPIVTFKWQHHSQRAIHK